MYVYNQSSNYGVSEGWYKWENNNFTKTETPTLTKNFAGIGTQEINENGIKAIRSVYEQTFNNVKKIQSEEFNENKFLDMSGNGDFTTGGNEFESRFKVSEKGKSLLDLHRCK